jgi:putative DNA primase/helicase
MKTIDAARGRWREILPPLGIPLKFLNGKHQPCPACGGRDRARFDDRRGAKGFVPQMTLRFAPDPYELIRRDSASTPSAL